MAFFNNSIAYDSQLRRKRSTSTNREKSSRYITDNEQRPSIDEGSQRKRSISSSSPSLQEGAPPLPTPVSAGLSRGRTNLSSPTAERPQTRISYDHSSTPIPFTKQTRRDSPSTSTKLLIGVTMAEGWIDPHNLGPTQRAVSPPLTGSSHRVATSPSSPPHYHVPTKDEEHSQISCPKSDNEWPLSPPEERNQHALPKTRGSPSRKSPCDTLSINLPTPVSSTKGQMAYRPNSSLAPAPSPRACSVSPAQGRAGSPAARSIGSAPGSPRSSVRRVPVPAYDQSEFAGAPGVASGSSTKSPTRDVVVMQPVKRSRNVLRKPSITRNREPQSSPNSDSEKKAKAPRPRANSVVVSPSRLPGGVVFDISQPLPTMALDLTPAGEVLAAYQESQRIAGVTPFESPGTLVAVGAPDDVTAKESPMTPQRKGTRSGEEDNTTTNSVALFTRSLTRKLSKKWNRGSERRHQDPNMQGVSGPDSGKLSPRDPSEKLFVAKPVDMHIGASPGPTNSGLRSGWPKPVDMHIGASPGPTNRGSRSGWPNVEADGEGRVWEDSIDDWVWTHKLDSKDSKDVADAPSSGRLWSLVKRFSSGNLKDKRSVLPHSPPPVPPLPKDFTLKTAYAPDDGEMGEMPITFSAVPETTSGLMRYITNVPSLSIPQPKNSSSAKASPSHHRHEPDLGPTSSPLGSQSSAPRRWRSVTTRSSSPSSGTTGFFSRSRSSSTSSYGDAVPPVPSVPPARADNRDRERGEDSGLSRRNSGKNSKLPRKSQDDSSIGSVSIPWFNMQNSINKFAPKGKRSMPSPIPTTHFPDYKPVSPQADSDKRQVTLPPIPLRNPRRLGSHSISVSTHTSSKHSAPHVIPVQDTSESELTDTGRSQARGRRIVDVRKPRPRSLSAGVIVVEADALSGGPKPLRSTMIYREMTAHQRPLTEEEKNEKWEDLLKRSDKAGGTLHVGSSTSGGLALWSDRSSMATSITLDQF
ncbi:hypothetical protein BU17DRAFT_96875 [Hysterangium stoloniferum]|nr:hypothetical protein BU17DRAFT_96875 [Hysterangium stoloniferum]